ncbi:3-dehydroquinate synthase [Pseudoneobacillus rhizosphaerae]|uniref:3-dehydroquinate synthase n=1 Tax=Pseudoneobacillus rhizosphaerae TaxID=2880968 RepID=A0A9C7G9Y6_9BACI|nr:3-dehydroquinate synthase [Pseudoneobacillus rhizosphaerae]CAG9608303.1 3-dehydroquinate synthase [Pseudoneobacillus rhizosphaerae]
MEKISINTESKNYSVFIGHGVITELPLFLKSINQLSQILIVTDRQVSDLHLSGLMEMLKDFNCSTFITPIGEAAKTFDVYYQALGFALENKLDRNSVLLAFGGGAIGDLGGFIAATYMRGIRFIQIPTTILAHDSAVGGKVAINHPVGKNMIGSFYQPDSVFYDLSYLNTLSIKEKRSGFAELIKHSLLEDYSFYNSLTKDIESLENLNSEKLQALLSKGIKVKAKVVSKDEKELGDRAFLNLGHTLGHAIEAEVGYGKITHGEAVVIGMIFALRLSMEMLNLTFDLNGFTNWLHKLGYDTAIPSNLKTESLVKRMKQDKKAHKEEIRMVLLSNIGQPVLKTIPEDVILQSLKSI